MEVNEKEVLRRTKDELWGWESDSGFVPLPKLPLIRAGLTVPPFFVTRPDGKTLHVIAKPNPGANNE